MKKRPSIIIVVVGLMVASIVAGVIVLGTGHRSEPGLVPVTVRLKWLHQAQFAGCYVARERGFYEDAGMNVELAGGGVDFPAIQMVAGGAEQFGVTGADQILLAREKGVPIVALAVIYRKSPMVFFSLSESGITKPQHFTGRRVGVKPGGNEELTYRAMMRKAGIDMKEVTEVPVKYDMTPLFTGNVDVWPGYAINEPIVAEEQGHKVSLIWPTDYGVNLYADTLFTTEKVLAEQPEMVERFVRATLRGWAYALDHPDEAVACTLKYGKELNEQHETRMMQASIPLVKPDARPVGWMDEGTWQEMAELLLEQGFLKRRIDVSSAFTTRFLTAESSSNR